jgi:hypothetical protein
MIDSLAVLACRRARPAAVVRRAEGLSLSLSHATITATELIAAAAPSL